MSTVERRIALILAAIVGCLAVCTILGGSAYCGWIWQRHQLQEQLRDQLRQQLAASQQANQQAVQQAYQQGWADHKIPPAPPAPAPVDRNTWQERRSRPSTNKKRLPPLPGSKSGAAADQLVQGLRQQLDQAQVDNLHLRERLTAAVERADRAELENSKALIMAKQEYLRAVELKAQLLQLMPRQ